MNPTFWNGGGGLLAGVELPTLKLCCCIGGSDIVGSGITDSVWKSLATQTLLRLGSADGHLHDQKVCRGGCVPHPRHCGW
eukprot:357949-Chlamydomonas_euryale.AAC.7